MAYIDNDARAVNMKKTPAAEADARQKSRNATCRMRTYKYMTQGKARQEKYSLFPG